MQGVSPVRALGIVPKRPTIGSVDMSRNAPKDMAGIILACGIRGVSGRRAPWRPGCSCKKRTPFHTPYKARRYCSYPPDRRGLRLGWYPHFHGRYTQKPIGKEKTRKKAMGFARSEEHT